MLEKKLYAGQGISLLSLKSMKTESLSKPRIGRKPSGRVTKAVNIRLEESIQLRLVTVSEKHKPRITQVALMEEGLETVLPKYEHAIQQQVLK